MRLAIAAFTMLFVVVVVVVAIVWLPCVRVGKNAAPQRYAAVRRNGLWAT